MASATDSLAHSAIGHDAADAAFAALERFDGVLIAVSGGPDSLALLYLLADWAARRMRSEPQRPTPRLFAATVDHQLRKESAAEARIVAEHCAKLSIPHATLVWSEPKPWSGVAAEARRARYRLLQDHAALALPAGTRAVVTGHTLDDQAETLLMRLQRGSGVEGLAAMPDDRPIAPASEIHLVRPLLGFPKTRLIGTLQAQGIAWAEDPTNDDPAYERVRIRKTLTMMQQRGFSNEALARTTRRMHEASDAIAFAEQAFRRTLAIEVHDGVGALLNRQAFDAGPRLLRQRVLAKLIAGFGSPALPAELSEIEALAVRLEQPGNCGATLGGARLSAGPRKLSVFREAGRIKDAPVPIPRNSPVLWDDRFWVSAAGRATADGLYVSALGEAGYRAIAPDLASPRPLTGLPVAALYGLPAIRKGGKLLAVPTLGVFVPDAGDCAGALITCDPISAATLKD